MDQTQQPAPSFNLPTPVDAPKSSDTKQPPVHSMQSEQPHNTSLSPHRDVQFGDELEAKWIQAVEQAIRSGIDNPRLLSKQLDAIRAEYVEGRFAKQVKRQVDGDNA